MHCFVLPDAKSDYLVPVNYHNLEYYKVSLIEETKANEAHCKNWGINPIHQTQSCIHAEVLAAMSVIWSKQGGNCEVGKREPVVENHRIGVMQPLSDTDFWKHIKLSYTYLGSGYISLFGVC